MGYLGEGIGMRKAKERDSKHKSKRTQAIEELREDNNIVASDSEENTGRKRIEPRPKYWIDKAIQQRLRKAKG